MSPTTTNSVSVFSILTPPVPAAIGLIELRGPLVAAFLATCTARPDGSPAVPSAASDILRRRLVLDGCAIDDVLLLCPSGSGDSSVWISLHGNPGILAACETALRAFGFEQRQATGDIWPATDFVDREIAAALPRMLTQAGVAWLIRQGPLLRAALTQLSSCAAADPSAARHLARHMFAGRGIIEWFARPLRVALVGLPNVGKSTLINRLTDSRVSIVLPSPGTTRDYVSAPGELLGYPVEWIDTAGLRDTRDPIESEGVRRARAIARDADVVCMLATGTQPAAVVGDLATDRPILRVLTKLDLLPASDRVDCDVGNSGDAISISALQNRGIDSLRAAILDAVGRPPAAALLAPVAFSSAAIAAIARICPIDT